jgi:hypothetical protein
MVRVAAASGAAPMVHLCEPVSVDARHFEDWTARLEESVAASDDVDGLVLLGSTADVSRVDEWSDHDFFLLVRPGTEAAFRTDLTWLPDHERIAFSARDSEHGVKVLWDDGHVAEFAVAPADEAAHFGGSPQRVVLDRGDRYAHERATAQTASDAPDNLTRFRLFLFLVLIGTGRVRRGEVLAGGRFVRCFAADHLLALLDRHLPDESGSSDARARVDEFDPWRRFEARHPVVGDELADALTAPSPSCGRELLSLARRHLGPAWPEYPRAEEALVRDHLGR